MFSLAFIFNRFSASNEKNITIPYSQFLDEVETNKIKDLIIFDKSIQGQWLKGIRIDNTQFMSYAPFDQDLLTKLVNHHIKFNAIPKENSIWADIFISWFPMLLLIFLWFYFMRGAAGKSGGSGGIGGIFNFSKNRATMIDPASNPIRFSDVAGCKEAKDEVQELVSFLKNPTKYQNLGGVPPKGFLLSGSPGTGKTLLAKAIAGEASVPFFSISGSDFVEMFVGIGAARVRELFAQAKKFAPAIIFIDEIDAVGRKRGSGVGGGNDEREQTLNQMLVEMDGFGTNNTVIIIAATNRPDVLDPALIRAGRFDRQIVVPLPDIRGRLHILYVHSKKIALDYNVDLLQIARATPGFSGADLANLINEAALMAATQNDDIVSMQHLEQAKDKIFMGTERKSMVMLDKERKNTAYHESGHAIVARMLPDADPVYKVTIIPRGRALGVTMQLPEEDKYSHDKKYLLTQIAILFGGRIAEEIFMDQMTTGASNDFERATELARKMVVKFGMTQELGPMVYTDNETDAYIGRSSFSQTTMAAIDQTIRKILDEQYLIAKNIILENRDKLETMAKLLLKQETIDSNDIDHIINGTLVIKEVEKS
jgi:cell division protease FtsH